MATVPKPTALTATYACKYDAWNRLVEVKSGATVVAKYEYDGTGRRIKAHIDAQAPAEPDGVDHYRHFYYNAGWQILETRNRRCAAGRYYHTRGSKARGRCVLPHKMLQNCGHCLPPEEDA
jgi:YD repeat-containing protein